MQQYTYKTLSNGPPNAVYGVDISPDGNLIAAGSLNHAVYVWDTDTWAVKVFRAIHADGISSVKFSRDASKILTTSLDKTVKILNSSSGNVEVTLSGHSQAVLCGIYAGPIGKRIVTTGFDNTVRIWTESGEVRQMGGLTPYTYGVDVSPDGNWITAGSLSSQVITWNQDGTQLHAITEHEEGIYSVAYSKADNNQFATGGGKGMIALWDRKTGKVTGRLRGHKGNIRSLAYSHDGRRLASGGTDGVINLWNLQTYRKITSLKGHRNTVYSLAFSYNGHLLVSGSFDRRVNVWKLKQPSHNHP